MECHIDDEKLLDFGAFHISSFWIRDAQHVCKSVYLSVAMCIVSVCT